MPADAYIQKYFQALDVACCNMFGAVVGNNVLTAIEVLTEVQFVQVDLEVMSRRHIRLCSVYCVRFCCDKPL